MQFFYQNSQKYSYQSQSYMLSSTECGWELQNTALWDTHLHALKSQIPYRTSTCQYGSQYGLGVMLFPILAGYGRRYEASRRIWSSRSTTAAPARTSSSIQPPTLASQPSAGGPAPSPCYDVTATSSQTPHTTGRSEERRVRKK